MTVQDLKNKIAKIGSELRYVTHALNEAENRIDDLENEIGDVAEIPPWFAADFKDDSVDISMTLYDVSREFYRIIRPWKSLHRSVEFTNQNIKGVITHD